MTLFRRKFALGTLLAVAAAAAALTPAHSQGNYPQRPIKILVPFPAGGGTDNLARLVGHKLTDTYGWTIVVENKPGSGGNLALDQTAKAPADGLTLVMAQTDNVVLNPLLYTKLTYNPDKDLRPVALVAAGAAVLVVNADAPYKTLDDLMQAARKDPGRLSFATPGTGTISHLVSEAWQKSSDVKFVHIPYRGMASAMPDLMGGRIDMYMGSIPTLLPHIQSGKVRALGVTSARRSKLLPNVPTYAESGIKGVELASVWGVMAPAGTPDAVVRQLNEAINKVVTAPDAAKKIADSGAELITGTPEDMAKLYASDRARLAPIVKSSGTTLD
ncbi:Bug family tripartite tricarboxylate transporter substrate binding protein [Acidovorax sp. M2(2025)]|uniref:Bug family tripartite tricarboxylate transporter substrate binding protein n=1 Tax=Acidovorax sp. M2(2025) TaxID=3411355 RepID=UPI003BF56A35